MPLHNIVMQPHVNSECSSDLNCAFQTRNRLYYVVPQLMRFKYKEANINVLPYGSSLV